MCMQRGEVRRRIVERARETNLVFDPSDGVIVDFDLLLGVCGF